MADAADDFKRTIKDFSEVVKSLREVTQQQQLNQKNPALAGLALAGGHGTGADFAKVAGKASGGIDSAISMAGGGILSAFAEMGGKLTQFIEALNPSAVMVFGAAMKDLSAVIGTALMPIFEALTQAVKEAADLLLPVAQELAPIFGQMAQTVLSVLQPVLQLVAAQVRALAPLLQVFADVMKVVAPLMQAWYTVLSAVTETFAAMLSSLLGDNYKSGMDNFRTAMEKLASAALVGVAALAKWADGLGIKAGGVLLDKLIGAVKGGSKIDATGLGAATAGQVTSIASFEQSELAKAFTASALGGDKEKSQSEWLKELAGTLEGIRDGQLNAKEEARKLLLEAAKFIVKGIVAGLGGQVNEALAPSPQTAEDAAAVVKSWNEGGWVGALAEWGRRRV